MLRCVPIDNYALQNRTCVCAPCCMFVRNGLNIIWKTFPIYQNALTVQHRFRQTFRYYTPLQRHRHPLHYIFPRARARVCRQHRRAPCTADCRTARPPASRGMQIIKHTDTVFTCGRRSKIPEVNNENNVINGEVEKYFRQ